MFLAENLIITFIEQYMINDINKIKLPLIGYGTFPRKEELITCIPNAYNIGFRLYDTSDDYENIEYVGKGIDLIPQKDVGDVLLQTKISNWTFGPDQISSKFKKMKSDLGSRYVDNPIDILLLHFPYPFIMKDAWKELEKLYESGEVKAIGVCNFKVKHLKKLLKTCKIKPMINQIELHPLFQQKDITDFCKREGIIIESYSPFARMDKRLIDNEKLLAIAKEKRMSVTSIIIRWNIQKGFIPLPSSGNVKHMLQNFNYRSFELSADEMKIIDSIESGLRTRFDTDKMFSLKEIKQYLLWHIKYVIKLLPLKK